MADGFLLSEDDARTLRTLIERERKRKPPSRPPDPFDGHNPPDVYIAKTPAGGIPALTSGAGTGTASADQDRPGSAVCDVYRIFGDNVRARVRPIFSFTKLVYNLSSSAVPGNSWVVVVKEKAGHWLTTVTGATTGGTPPPGGGSGSGGGQCSLASLRQIDCVKLDDAGDDDVFLRYTGSSWTGTNGRGPWVFGWDAAVGISYLTLNGLRLMNCGNGCFTGGALTGHLGQAPDGVGTGSGSPPVDGNGTAVECTGEQFTVCLSCHCCTDPNYHGPGWYCVATGTGSGPDAANCEPLYLTDQDACDVVICLGPYASSVDAFLACPPAGGVEGSSCPATGALASPGTWGKAELNQSGSGSSSFSNCYRYSVSPSTTYSLRIVARMSWGVNVGGLCSMVVAGEGVSTGTMGSSPGNEAGNQDADVCGEFTTGPSQTEVTVQVDFGYSCSSSCLCDRVAYFNVLPAGSC